MRETASICCCFLAFALWHAAARGRFPLRRATPARGARAPIQRTVAARLAGGAPVVVGVLRTSAALALLVAIASWTAAEGTTAALLVALTALSVAATLFVLLVPIFPRTMWTLALACPPVIIALLLGASCHG